MGSSPVGEDRVSALFRRWDVDRSGHLEKWEFDRMCSELRVQSADVDAIFSELDADEDGTINMEEFVCGFKTVSSLTEAPGVKENMTDGETSSQAWEDFNSRLGEQSKFVPR